MRASAGPATSAITVPKLRRGSAPRYFFHFSDGKRRFSDTVGHELHGLAAARKHTVQQVRELKPAMCDPHIQDLSGWSMTVADTRGGTVFEIGFDLGNQGSGIRSRETKRDAI